MEGVRRCLEGVRVVSGGCLEGVWKVSKMCLEGVWKAQIGPIGPLLVLEYIW